MKKKRLRTSIWAGLAVALACRAGVPSGPPVPSGSPGVLTKLISFAILEDYDKGDDLDEIARDFARFQELGVPVWRGSFGWDDYEPAPGRYDFRWLDRFVALADSMGITLRPYIGYTPAWAGRPGRDEHAWNDPPRRIEDWTRFVSTLATRYAGAPSIRSYEIYNEENVPLWWEGTAGEYAVVLQAGARAIRRADPDAQILLGGMVWPDLDWLEVACATGRAPFDVLPFHAYPETWTPDSITVENYLGPGYRTEFLPEADQQCGRRPVWINEAGFATTPGKSEREQAEWWMRAFATFLAEPRVEHLGIYEIRDQQQGTPVIGDAPNYYLGLLRVDGSPKLSFTTIQLLVRLFGTDSVTVADPSLRVRVTGGHAGALYHHLFLLRDGRQLAFVWDRSGSPTVELEVPEAIGGVTAYGSDGQGTQWDHFRGRVIRRVRLEPGVVRIFEADPEVDSEDQEGQP